MKRFIQFLVLPVISVALFVACADKGDNAGDNYNYPYGNGGYYNAMNAGQSYRGTVQITNRSHYKRYLKEIGRCFEFGFDFCRQIDSNPNLSINFFGKELNTTKSIDAQVSFTIGGDYGAVGAQPYPARFYAINNNAGLEARVLGMMGTGSYNGELRLVITGAIDDQQINVEIYYREGLLGRSTLFLAYNPYGGGGYYPYGGYRRF